MKHKQPKSLYQLSHCRFSAYLCDKVIRACHDSQYSNQTLSVVRIRLRPFFIENIPVLVRTSLLEETSQLLFQKSCLVGFESDYGKTILYLLCLLLCKEVRRLRMALCCYYGCRDMEGALRCVKRNGSSLEYLEFSRSSLLRMDPLLFRNVLTSASKLHSLILKNICSDAMLKLIGTHCQQLQHLDISSSKQVTDVGVENLCFQVMYVDKNAFVTPEAAQAVSSFEAITDNYETFPPTRCRMLIDKSVRGVDRVTIQEDFGMSNSGSCSSSLPWWRDFRQRMRNCLPTNSGSDEGQNSLTIEVRQVLQPLCNTLRVFDITDTSITNAGLLIILRKLLLVHSLGEFSISDSFLRSLRVVSSLKMDKFTITNLHSRKISYVGMYNMVHVFPHVKSFTCWEPQFELTDFSYFYCLRQITLLRINFSETTVSQLLKYIETSKGASFIERISLEFVLTDESAMSFNTPDEFDISRYLNKSHSLKVFTVEFKDSPIRRIPVIVCNNLAVSPNPPPSLVNLVHVQFGLVVTNSAVASVLMNCPNLKYFHANNCPDLKDSDLSACVVSSKCNWTLECFYVYEAPQLTVQAFQIILDGFPNLAHFGNLTRWAINCEGITQVLRTIRDNNLEMEILCGSHWFSSSCSEIANSF